MKVSAFPRQEWEHANPAEHGVNPEALKQIEPFIALERPATTSLVVIRHGFLVSELYFRGKTRDSLLPIRSVTKTVIGSLIGVAIQQGYIGGIDTNLVEVFPELASFCENNLRKRLTLKTLLSLTDGWRFNEEDPNDPAWQTQTQAKYMLEQCPLVHEPGTHFNYSSLTTQVLSHIITRVTGRHALDYAKQTLFDRMAIDTVEWPINQEGDAWGGGGLKMRPVDAAKIGLLYLRGGLWRDERLLPDNFIRAATQAHSQGGPPCDLPYGYCMWLSNINGHDAWLGLGFGGQRLVMVPALDTVCVSTNATDERGLELSDLASFIEQWSVS